MVEFGDDFLDEGIGSFIRVVKGSEFGELDGFFVDFVGFFDVFKESVGVLGLRVLVDVVEVEFVVVVVSIDLLLELVEIFVGVIGVGDGGSIDESFVGEIVYEGLEVLGGLSGVEVGLGSDIWFVEVEESFGILVDYVVGVFFLVVRV